MNGTPPEGPAQGDMLFVANTRPVAPGGVPFLLTFGAVFGVVVIVLVMQNPAWFLLLAPIWGFLRVKASKDLHIGNTVLGWALGAGRSSHRRAWGGSTVSPLAPNPKRFGIFR